jgi:hypothetical protein
MMVLVVSLVCLLVEMEHLVHNAHVRQPPLVLMMSVQMPGQNTVSSTLLIMPDTPWWAAWMVSSTCALGLTKFVLPLVQFRLISDWRRLDTSSPRPWT